MRSSASIPRQAIRIHLRPSALEGRDRGVSAISEPEPSPVSTQTRSFWALMFYAVALGAFGAVAALLFMGVIGVGNNWYTDSRPWLVRRPVVVDRRDRRGRSPCRSPPTVDPPARRDVRSDCRPARRTRRSTPGPRHRGRLGRLPHRRCQPGPGKGARLGRRRARHVDLSAPAIQRGRIPRTPHWPASAAPTADCSQAPSSWS